MKLLSIKGLDEDAFKAVNLRSEMTEEIAQGVLDNMEAKVGPIVEVTGKNVATQRQRLGGDWAVALAVFSRSQRESLRKIHITPMMTRWPPFLLMSVVAM